MPGSQDKKSVSNVGPTRPDGASSLRRRFSWMHVREQAIQWVLFGCALLSVLTTVSIIYVLITESVYALPPHTAFFQEVSIREFFTETRWTPQYAEEQQHYGILPLVTGTFLITGISAIIGLPVGLLIAIYLSEYASPSARTPMLIVPIFEYWLGMTVYGKNALAGGIVVGLMIIPMVASLSEDVMRSVPNSLRESGYALGSTKFDVSSKIVVPAALSGIFASFLLALSRSIGETMAVAIASAGFANLTLNPLAQIQTMTSYIVDVMTGEVVSGSTVEKSLYAVALVLFIITMMMNLISQWVLSRYREVYQ